MQNLKNQTAGISRRTFVCGALATSAAIALAGTKAVEPMLAFADDADVPEPDEDTTGAVQGGTVSYYLTNPVGIEPSPPRRTRALRLFTTCLTHW